MGGKVTRFIDDFKIFFGHLYICVDNENNGKLLVEADGIEWRSKFELPIMKTDAPNLSVSISGDKLMITGTSFDQDLYQPGLRKSVQHNWVYELTIPARIDQVQVRKKLLFIKTNKNTIHTALDEKATKVIIKCAHKTEHIPIRRTYRFIKSFSLK